MNLEDAIQSSKFKDLKQKAVINILYTAWWLKTILSKELKELGLTQEQYNVLRILKGKYPTKMCVRDVGNRMIEKNSNVPRIIDRLELKKYVERSTSSVDKRETVITLTAAGINVLKKATEKTEALFTDIVECNETDAAELNRLLEQLRVNE